MKPEISKIEYGGWPNCYRLSDGQVEIIATTDVGPRIVRCGFVGDKNLFAELEGQMGKTGGDRWLNYAGHRLWHSPEKRNRTYWPDNTPIEISVMPDGLRLKQYVEPNTGIEKEIVIGLRDCGGAFDIEHRMTNRNVWPVEFSIWALSVMRPGGLAIVPQNRTPDAEGLLPNRSIALWPYTDMNDSRVTWGERYITLKQDPTIPKAFKFGMTVPDGWMAYLNEGQLFAKKFHFDAGAVYPDYGVNVEIYTRDTFLELETLSPLLKVNPGQTVHHIEKWLLFRDVGQAAIEREIDAAILPLMK